MDRISIPFSSLRPTDGHAYEFDGLLLKEKQLKDICSFTSVPASLIGVDAKYGTHTLTQVLTTLDTNKIDALVDGDQIQILDPKSQFCSDEEFDSFVSLLGDDVAVSSTTFGKTATVTPESTNADFLGDLFTKSIKLDRLPQGGLALQMGLLRLACSNGLLLNESGMTYKIRKASLDSSLADTFKHDVNTFDLDSHFRSIFTRDGEFIPISVADYLGMKSQLAKISDPDTADLYFPTDIIENHYGAQDIDIYRINKKFLNNLPAGVSYYDSLNFLTNAAKHLDDLTLEDKVAIGSWASSSRMKTIQSTQISFKGTPQFSSDLVEHLRGDR